MRSRELEISVNNFDLLKIAENKESQAAIKLSEYYSDAFGGDSDVIRLNLSNCDIFDLVNTLSTIKEREYLLANGFENVSKHVFSKYNYKVVFGLYRCMYVVKYAPNTKRHLRTTTVHSMGDLIREVENI